MENITLQLAIHFLEGWQEAHSGSQQLSLAYETVRQLLFVCQIQEERINALEAALTNYRNDPKNIITGGY